MNARSRLPDLLNQTCHTPLDYDSEVHGPVEQYYKPWGFEIYRTSYHPLVTTDTQWATLCAKIVEQVHAGIDSFAEPGDEQIAARLKDSFFLNQHSDPGLQNKSVAGLRVMYLGDARARGEAPEGQLFPDDEVLRYNTYPGPGLFLLADAEVLEGVIKDAYFWVKAVIPDFDEENERDPELEPSMWVSPDGWFRMTTHSIVDLCMDLPHYQQMELPPRTSQKWNVYNGEMTGLDPADSMCSGK